MAKQLLKQVRHLEAELADSPSIPLTPLNAVNSDKVLALIDSLREELPDAINQAHHVLAQREQLLGEAAQQAQDMLEEAQQHQESLLSEDELMKTLEEEALSIRQQLLQELETLRKATEDECQAMKAEAFEEANAVKERSELYAAETLEQLHRAINAMNLQLQAGQEEVKALQAQPPETFTSRPASPSTSPGKRKPEQRHGSQRQAVKRRPHAKR